MKYITVGPWLICVTNGNVSIVHDSGESGEFDAAKFAKVIREFFNREF